MLVSASALLVHISQSLRTSAYPLLAAACEHDHSTGGADLTLADCLAPATACSRSGDGMSCVVSGSALCAARDADDALHSIFDGGPCRRAIRSATAIALVALAADLEIATSEGDRWMSAEAYFARIDVNAKGGPPTQGRVLRARLPLAGAGGFQRLSHSTYGDGAISAICLAAVRRSDGDVRLVFGGVSPRPYRVYTSVEEEAMAGGLDADAIAGLADRALLDAEADPRSTARVDAAAGLLRHAIQEIASS